MNMRRILLSCIALAPLSLFAIAASQAWVSNYVERALSLRDVVRTVTPSGELYTVGSGNARITAFIENADVAALLATNCTAEAVSSGVTNGMWFVWNSDIDAYTNRAETIYATPTNLVWRSIQSDGPVFDGYFAVLSRLIQPVFARRVGQ